VVVPHDEADDAPDLDVGTDGDGSHLVSQEEHAVSMDFVAEVPKGVVFAEEADLEELDREVEKDGDDH
jgi:hypothetical protein